MFKWGISVLCNHSDHRPFPASPQLAACYITGNGAQKNVEDLVFPDRAL